MSPDDLETKLGRLVRVRPRADLREEILARVAHELDRPGRLDRLLALRASWAAAAALLLAVIGANTLLESRYRHAMAEIRGEPPILAATLRERRLERAEAVLLEGMDDPDLRNGIRFRLRGLRLPGTRLRAALSRYGIPHGKG